MSLESGPTEALQWPDEIDEIITGDLVVTVGSPTPAREWCSTASRRWASATAMPAR